MTTKIARLAPLSGIAFVLTMIGIVALEGDELPARATAQEVLAHWADRSDTRLLLTTLAAFAALFLVVFAASLRGMLRAREHAEASASAVAFGGGVLAAGAILTAGLINLSAARAGDDGAVDAVVALDHLTPGGLVGFLLSPLWIIAVSVIAYRRTSRFVAATERDTVLAAEEADR